MLEETAARYYREGNYNCAEAVLRGANEAYRLGLAEETLRAVGGFGGGLGCGLTCGALCGAMAALSCMRMHEKAHETPGFRRASGDLARFFQRELGGSGCAELKAKYHSSETRCEETVRRAARVFEAFLNKEANQAQ